MIQPTWGTPRRKITSVANPEASEATEMPQRRRRVRHAPLSAPAIVRGGRNGAVELDTPACAR
jgi:hypothetical protein